MTLIEYRGNKPKAVKKAAKYHIKYSDGDWVVQLQYVLNKTERALLTTDDHPDLVAMVNEVKEETNGVPGGAFYINEYSQVVVPSTAGDYFLAGCYERLLEFDFDGEVVSSRAPDGITPGDHWDGPHVGIPYTVSAGRDDIKYKVKYHNIEETKLLSEVVGKRSAEALAGRLGEHKPNGGRVYINECREFFAPIPGSQDDGWHFIYLGPLGGDPWFPRPE